jgi:TPR repeat protein
MKMSGNCPFCRAKTPSSDEEEVKYLRPWVKKKKAWAQSHLGEKYFHGKGVKQSYEMAKRLFEQAAQQGDVSAMYNLGRLYESGGGVEQSYEKAFEYYEQAAELGLTEAQFNLGNMYYNGYGVVRDIVKAREWWKKAAAQGHQQAIQNLQLWFIFIAEFLQKNKYNMGYAAVLALLGFLLIAIYIGCLVAWRLLWWFLSFFFG